ncbi:HD-GYP domain-containing protein [Pseudodesulfovibrio sediminis]|uniref:HD family phosphohydrolase n=1 Tax=Pseudodesulfovibrio sediminis TaxID=2810563 RepID=A0ABN6EU43_9BACT|nr:HD-GYP domain-containing protein [Pseudodesulfovibrio sediminis]BCS88569.1 HD family phosphohydrolase [Pseudodesulfovibrio sediminis]
MIKKISIDELKPGMEVVQLASDLWKHLPYMYTEPGVIESEEVVARLRKEGYQQVFVEVPDVSGLSDEERLDMLIVDRDIMPLEKERTPFDEAMPQSQVTYENAMKLAIQIVNDAKLGRKMDVGAAMETASAIVDAAISNPDTLVCLSKLSSFDNYTYTHSINVAAIAVVFGEFIGMERDELTLLGLAGMMHDVGKTSVPAKIINKPDRLTKLECTEVKRHPGYGCTILEQTTDIPKKVIEAVMFHHERFNGSGYPSGLIRKEIPANARILGMADVYDALTSDRCYKQAIQPNKALGIMYGMRDQDFDPMEIQLFIKCLGIFPSGSFVRLNTGDYALVFETDARTPLFPKIKIVMDRKMRPIRMQEVNLATQSEEDTPIEILECADPSAYRKTLMTYLSPN